MTCTRYVIIFSLIIVIFCPFQESKALTVEKSLPQFTLNLNGDSSTQQYLGLKNNKSFSAHPRSSCKIIMVINTDP